MANVSKIDADAFTKYVCDALRANREPSLRELQSRFGGARQTLRKLLRQARKRYRTMPAEEKARPESEACTSAMAVYKLEPQVARAALAVQAELRQALLAFVPVPAIDRLDFYGPVPLREHVSDDSDEHVRVRRIREAVDDLLEQDFWFRRHVAMFPVVEAGSLEYDAQHLHMEELRLALWRLATLGAEAIVMEFSELLGELRPLYDGGVDTAAAKRFRRVLRAEIDAGRITLEDVEGVALPDRAKPEG